MNRYVTLFALLLLISGTVVGQSTRVSFSARDRHTAAPVQLDSVRVENLSTMRDTVITGTFVIDIKISTGLRERLSGLVHSLEISGNFANPFTDATNFTVTTTSRGSVQLELFSIAGRREADLNAELEAGAHQFSLKAASLPAGVYLLVARAGQSTSSVRIVKSAAAGGGMPALFYTGSSAGPGSGGFAKATAAMYRFTGYADTYHPEAIEAAPIGDTAIVFDMRRIQIAPVIDRFVCLNPVSFPGDTTVFEITASSALQSLSRILIDFESDGVMDDSVSASGGNAQATFRHAYTAAGMYNARACVTDLYGNISCKDLDSTITVRDPLPVLTTAPVTEITAATAKSGGNIASEGRSPVTARGVCWSTTPGAMITDSHTTDGAGTGSFISSLTGLTENTTYYLRAYATNSAGTAYGKGTSFHTTDPNNPLPVLTTDAVTEIAMTNATSGGKVISDGGHPVTARGVCWSESPGPTTANDKTSDGAGTGSFTSSITGLTENTTYHIRAYATNSEGTGYGNELSFRTLNPSDSLPVVTTVPVTEITVTTVRSGGNIASEGRSPVTARGVCWSISPAPTITDSHTTDGAGKGTFQSFITGLAENTRYYARAYATNSAGTGYGGEVQFVTKDTSIFVPILTTLPVTDITTTTGRSGGDITSDGGYPVTARGVCWSTSSGPTISGDKTSDGAGTGTFTSHMTGLMGNTTYHVRAYATNGVGTSYGNELTFTTTKPNDFLPVLTTIPVTGITATSASSGGMITSDGGYPITARGVCWGTSPAPTTADDKTSDSAGAGGFTSSITGLAENTTYYVRAYAINSAGTGYGNELSFETDDTGMYVPVLTTLAANDIKATTARSGGNITSDGGSAVTARGVCWSTSPGPTLTDSKTWDGAGTGSFTSNITGLAENTTYYVRAYATNGIGTGYGNEVSFRAQDLGMFVPVLTTSAVTDITTTAARSGGNIISDGGYSVTARGVCWSTSPVPTLADSVTASGTGIGSFTSDITSLTASTTYYVRAYATSIAGTGYGNELSFSTQNDSSGGDTIMIGTQVWMLKNLDVDKYRNGDPIPQVTDPAQWYSKTTGAWCYYNNDSTMSPIYGRLYNWYAVNDPRGLAPSGWHIPTDDEWKTLEVHLGMTQAHADSTDWRGTDEGGKLKETGTSHWQSPNTGASNSSGFTALPGGYRSWFNNAPFSGMGSNGYWWSSTADGAATAWNRILNYGLQTVWRRTSIKTTGYSVRCVRD